MSPIKSSKQFRLMMAAKHGKIKGMGPSEEVAKEMLEKTPDEKKSKFAKMRKK